MYPKLVCFKTAFLFPLQNKEACRDVLHGGLLLLVCWPFGWILNMGHRLGTVRRLYHQDTPYFRGFMPLDITFSRGLTALKTILLYTLPGLIITCGGLITSIWQSLSFYSIALASFGILLLGLGVFTLPGCMTVYAVEGDPTVLKRPIQAFKRACKNWKTYQKAWGISLTAIALSFIGLFPVFVGWLFTSVWAWEVTGYVFTVSMYGEDS